GCEDTNVFRDKNGGSRNLSKDRAALPILVEACRLTGTPFGNLNIDGKRTPLWLTTIIPLIALRSGLSLSSVLFQHCDCWVFSSCCQSLASTRFATLERLSASLELPSESML